MTRLQRNRVNRIVAIVFGLLLVMNINVSGQVVEDLTDRELLIQLVEKFYHLENSIKRIEVNSDIVRKEIISFDRRIYKNSMYIESLSKEHEGAISRWNILLGLFATFILGIFLYIWRKSYNGEKVE